MIKPPLGLVPRFVRDAERISEIIEAVERYIAEERIIPIPWIEEYNELAGKMVSKDDGFEVGAIYEPVECGEPDCIECCESVVNETETANEMYLRIASSLEQNYRELCRLNDSMVRGVRID